MMNWTGTSGIMLVKKFNKQMTEYKRWIIKALFLTLGVMLAPAAFIAIVDPYSIYELVTIRGFNENKTEAFRRTPMVKAHQVYKIKPRTIVLGASPADYGIDMNDPAWPEETAPRYNYAIGGNNLRETLAVLKYAHSVAPLKEVIIGLDFFSFNIHRANRAFMKKGFGYEKQNIIKEKLETLFSVDAIKDSFLTVIKQGNAGRREYDISTGKRNLYTMEEGIKNLGGQRIVMFHSTGYSYPNLLAAGPKSSYGFVKKNGESIFEIYREIISFAYENDIDLKLFISPQHIIVLEMLKVGDFWSWFEYWKKSLAFIAREEAARFSKEPFPVWDFASVNEFTTESLPDHNIRQAVMQNFLDSYHYTPKFGGFILTVLYGTAEKKIPLVRNLSTLVEIKPRNHFLLSEYFAEEREKIKTYKEKHVEIIKELNRSISLYGKL